MIKYEGSDTSKIMYEDSEILGIPESPPRILGDSGDSRGFWGFLGILGDSWGFLGILGILGDSWGFLGILRILGDSWGFSGFSGDSKGFSRFLVKVYEDSEVSDPSVFRIS